MRENKRKPATMQVFSGMVEMDKIELWECLILQGFAVFAVSKIK